MPARQPKQTAKKTAKQTATSKKKKAAASPPARRGARNPGPRVPKVKASWKPVSQATKSYVLHSFDAGVKLLTHKVPDKKYTEVEDALMAARNQVAVSLETLRVPASRHNYNLLSTTLVNLKELRGQLEQRQVTLTNTLENQEKELQQLQEEKVYLQDFGKTPGKHHPLILGSMEKELHLNFDTVK